MSRRIDDETALRSGTPEFPILETLRAEGPHPSHRDKLKLFGQLGEWSRKCSSVDVSRDQFKKRTQRGFRLALLQPVEDWSMVAERSCSNVLVDRIAGDQV